MELPPAGGGSDILCQMSTKPTLRVEEVTRADHLVRYRDAWMDLASRATHGELFTTYEWIKSWLAAFWVDQPIAFQFVWHGEQLVGLLPLLQDRDGALWCRNAYVTPVNPHTARMNVLSDGHPSAILDAVLHHLSRRSLPIRLAIKHLALDDPTGKSLLRSATRHGLGTTVSDAHRSLHIAFDADWPSYEQALPPHSRREMHRRERMIARAGTVRFSLVTQPSEVERAMSDVLDIETESWKHAEGTSMTAEPGAATFYRDLARCCARSGTLRLHFLLLNDRPVAYQYAVVHHDVFYALKTSYRMDVRTLSPGIVLMAHVLEEACGQRYHVDLLGTADDHKRHLANRSHRHVNVCVFSRHQPRCAWCRLVEHGVKPMVRTHAPAVLRWKRRWANRP